MEGVRRECGEEGRVRWDARLLSSDFHSSNSYKLISSEYTYMYIHTTNDFTLPFLTAQYFSMALWK